MPDTGHLLHTHVWFQKHWMYPVLTPQAPKSKNPRRFSELTSDLEFEFKLVSKFHIRHHLILKSHSPIVFITVKKKKKSCKKPLCE